MTQFSCGGDEDNALLIGTTSVHGGAPGIFWFNGDSLQRVDALATHDLCRAGESVVRLLGDDPGQAGSELLWYDELGVRRYSRLPELPELLHIAWDGTQTICASADSLAWLSAAGEVTRTSPAAGVDGAHRITGLGCASGQAYVAVTAMQERAPGGILRLADGQQVVAGLNSPHQFLLGEDGWAVCNSGAAELLILDPSGRRRRAVQLHSWTQGLARSDQFYFVGECVNRKEMSSATSAHLCMVERGRWQVCERIAVPGTEITFLGLLPRRFLAALRRGFRTNPYREAQHEAASLLRATGTDPLHILATTVPLPAESCRVTVAATAPARLMTGASFRLPVRVLNRGTAVLASAPPYPVHLIAQWLLPNGGPSTESWVRAPLARALPPGYVLESEIAMAAPAKPGQYLLKGGLVQDWVRYFDEVDPANSFTAIVAVEHASAPPVPADAAPIA